LIWEEEIEGESEEQESEVGSEKRMSRRDE